ncbi:MAG TPA: EAL domain-containing protein [Steroidobacteraceae bacterium]|jgi:PAS domain S-box-containing protein/diguanylate cyclase (GGDEF)-like protein
MNSVTAAHGERDIEPGPVPSQGLARVLMVEDAQVEAELVAHQLRKAGLAFCWVRVETESALRTALNDFHPTIILSDFSLPQFDGLAALRIASECAPETPFIFVSGTIGEERAIEALHRGASDYILKTNLKRLGPAVSRAVNEAAARNERRAIEQRLHDIVDTAQDWIWELDADRRFAFSSESVATILGYSPQQIVGTHLLDHLHEEDRAAAQLSLGGLGECQRHAPRAVYRWRHTNGSYRWLERNALALIDGGRVTGFRGAERDVTERREQEGRIARLTRVLQMLSGINSLVPRIRDRKELLQEACRFGVKTGGYAHAIVLLQKSGTPGTQPFAWSGVDDRITESLCTSIAEISSSDDEITERTLKAGSVFVCNDVARSGTDTATHAALLRAGCRSAVALPLVVDKTPIGILLLGAREAEVVSEHELRMLREMAANLSFALQYLQKDSTVRFLSYFNPQTGLARRSLFCERLGRLLDSSTDRHSKIAVAIVDIEQLSVINDSFGRHTGDLLLQHVADRLRQRIHNGELLAQFDGGTFAMVLTIPTQPGYTADALQETIAAVFGRPFQLEGCELPVVVKSAIAVRADGKTDANTLVQNAEAALRTVKTSGERHLCFDAERHSKIVARLTLEHKMRAALEQQQFELHYQPKVNVKTRRIEGVEALIRWRDPDAGLVSPAAFIPLLESTGFIVEVGDWVLERAAQDCQHWRQLGLPPIRIAVNISPVQLRRPDFLTRFVKLIAGWSTPDCGLDVEITEGTLLDDSDATLKKLERLRAAGARVAIDDFGTGYSSLSRLADLAIDTLKIDRSFIARLQPDDRSGKSLVRTIISLARTFNMTVVAEGVETVEQLGILWDMGCDQSQGYLHSKPISGEEMIQLLQSGHGSSILPPQSVESSAMPLWPSTQA